jgi:site-specific recombinase XerD
VSASLLPQSASVRLLHQSYRFVADKYNSIDAAEIGLDGFSANTLCQHFHWLYQRAGIEGASSHSGRRTFIANLAAKGVGVRVLASLAGHRSIATTQAYIDVNDDQKRKAVELA